MLETIARLCSAAIVEATQRSKSLLEQAFSYSTTFENVAPALFFRTFRSKSLLGHASKPLRAKSLLEQASLYATAFENTAHALLFRTFHSKSLIGCSAATGRSKPLFEYASKPFSVQNIIARANSLLIWQHFRVSFEISFEIALLRIVHCFELFSFATPQTPSGGAIYESSISASVAKHGQQKRFQLFSFCSIAEMISSQVFRCKCSVASLVFSICFCRHWLASCNVCR